VVVEETVEAKFQAPAGFTEIDRRAYDDTEFIFMRFSEPT
jgi:16S rRNA (guanine966-N2)-methyltransferase